MPVGAVLFSEMTPAPEWEGEFNAWYDDEHIPLRMEVPGFIGAQRYKADGRPGYLAVYDMTEESVLASDAYGKVKNHPSDVTARMLRDVTGFTRYIGRLSGWAMQDGVTEAEMLEAPVLYSVMFNVPVDRRAEFDDWYEQDHVPILLKADGWLGCRRYRLSISDPVPYTHLAIHHLAHTDALQSPFRAEARATEWRARLAAEDWFKGQYDVFNRHGDRFLGVAAD